MKRRVKSFLVSAGFALSLIFSLQLAGCLSPTIDTANLDAVSRAVTKSDITDDTATTTYTGTLTSYTRRSDEMSIGIFIADGVFDAARSLLTELSSDVSALKLNFTETGAKFNSLFATGADSVVSVTGKISVTDDSDGILSSDFTGAGTQIVAADYAKVTVDNMRIDTTGFLRDAFIADSHGQILINKSKVTVMGNDPLTNAWDGYVNSADQSIMMSPPWVLGIQGGARLANMLGDNATISAIDSELVAGAWAVLSTDAGSNAVINVLDSTLEILPASRGGMTAGPYPYAARFGSGYGTYAIGNPTENFYGATIKGTTYATIVTGGTVNCMSSKGTVTLTDAEGGAIGTYKGKKKPTTIDSVFGFMSHNTAEVNLSDGTVVNAQDAVFLYKAGDAVYNVDDSCLTSGTNVLLQMIDNDDSTVGVNMAGEHMPEFNTEFFEAAGWPGSDNGDVTDPSTASAGPFGPATSNTVAFNLTNGDYVGDIWNGTGYFTQMPDVLTVTVGSGASLKGAISLSEVMHVNENGDQNTYFTINEYYYLGHVANRPYYNGFSELSVEVTDGAVWTVTGTCYLTGLAWSGGKIVAPKGKTLSMTVDGVATVPEAGQSYAGEIVLTVD